VERAGHRRRNQTRSPVLQWLGNLGDGNHRTDRWGRPATARHVFGGDVEIEDMVSTCTARRDWLGVSFATLSPHFAFKFSFQKNHVHDYSLRFFTSYYGLVIKITRLIPRALLQKFITEFFVQLIVR
jgi:hypothetical protein